MVRVNLLPREVIDRRRFEQWYRYVFIGLVGGVLIVLFAYAGLFLMTQQKVDELQVLQEEATTLKAQADAFAVFEVKEQELVARSVVAQAALAGRINMGMLAEEISLVLPDEVWLDNMSLSQDTGVALSGSTPRSASESADVAYKSIAKLLVRLNELKSLYDVWLVSATNTTWNGWDVPEDDPKPLPADTVSFQVTSKIVIPAAPSTATPAPAATGGQ